MSKSTRKTLASSYVSRWSLSGSKSYESRTSTWNDWQDQLKSTSVKTQIFVWKCLNSFMRKKCILKTYRRIIPSQPCIGMSSRPSSGPILFRLSPNEWWMNKPLRNKKNKQSQSMRSTCRNWSTLLGKIAMSWHLSRWARHWLSWSRRIKHPKSHKSLST